MKVATRNKANSLHDELAIENSDFRVCSIGDLAQCSRVRPAVVNTKEPSRLSFSPEVLSDPQLEGSETRLSRVSEASEEVVCRDGYTHPCNLRQSCRPKRRIMDKPAHRPT